VAHKDLYSPYIHSLFKHMGCKTMPEPMESDIFCYFGPVFSLYKYLVGSFSGKLPPGLTAGKEPVWGPVFKPV